MAYSSLDTAFGVCGSATPPIITTGPSNGVPAFPTPTRRNFMSTLAPCTTSCGRLLVTYPQLVAGVGASGCLLGARPLLSELTWPQPRLELCRCPGFDPTVPALAPQACITGCGAYRYRYR